MTTMEQFEYGEPADLFVHARFGRGRSSVKYHSFATGAEAVKYAIEVLSKDAFSGAIIETEHGRYGSDMLRSLYDSSAFPLLRYRPQSPKTG